MSSSAIGSSFFEDNKFDVTSMSNISGSSYGSKLTTTVSVGLCGLAGRPNITMSESEAWIMDPRTPIKKFAALIFKLANIRNQIFKQLQKEFVEIKTIGGGSGGNTGKSADSKNSHNSSDLSPAMGESPEGGVSLDNSGSFLNVS